MSAEFDILRELTDVGHEPGRSRGSPGKAVAWARVSTDMQDERGASIPGQLSEIREYAEEHGIEIVEEFHEAVSAYQAKAKRVEFDRMLSHAKNDPDVSIILVHDLSRFSRDSALAKQLIRELRLSGVRVVSLNDPEMDPETVSGVYLEAITLAKNEAYSREVAMHTRKGCRANIRTRDTETGWCYKNGGQPLWGYRMERLIRGTDKRGRQMQKSIWLPDEAIVAGRPVREWTRHCLVELAANGASLDELRDFCNERGIPARRGRFWSTSTWYSLLQPHALLQFCGYGVWNVHRKNGSTRPPSEWVLVERAHPAIITEEEAKTIAAARRRNSTKRFGSGAGRARKSPYVLSGGIFVCGRCGSNMVGHTTSHGRYYVCASRPNRRGAGCGPGVYVRKEDIEGKVTAGLNEVLDACVDPGGFTKVVNDEIRDIWRASKGYDPHASEKIERIDAKIANVRRAVEDGYSDGAWASSRLEELKAERELLATATEVVGDPPQIDAETARSYRKRLPELLASATHAERKQLMQAWLEHIRLAPERLEVEITYRVPELVVDKLVAGAGFEPATFGL